MGNLTIQSKNLEKLILQASANNLSFFMKVKSYLETKLPLDKSYFEDDKYQIIFNLYSRFFDKHKKQPKKSTFDLLLESYVKKVKLEEDTYLYLQKIADNMYSNEEEFDVEEIEEITIDFIKKNRVYESIKDSESEMSSGNYDKLVSRMEEAVRVSFDKDLGLSIKDYEKVFETLNSELNSSRVVSSGYSKLDGFMDGGFYPKSMYVFAGLPGSGKTQVMGNFALNAFNSGYKVLFYTFETSTSRLIMRSYTNLINQNKKEIILNQESVKQKLEKELSDTLGDLIIKEYNSGAASSNDIMTHINDLSMYKGWKPDIIFVDYILIMSTDDKRRSNEDKYGYFKTVSEELRNISKTLGVPLITAAQINRDGMSDRGGSKSIITPKDVSESRGILDTCDFFCSIIQTAKHRQDNKIQLHNNKNRNDSTEWRIEMEVDYEHMKLKEGALISG